MRYFFIICAVLLLLGVANVPIGYYTFLRIVVTIGAVLAVIFEYRNGINIWVIAFGLIAILFNPPGSSLPARPGTLARLGQCR